MLFPMDNVHAVTWWWCRFVVARWFTLSSVSTGMGDRFWGISGKLMPVCDQPSRSTQPGHPSVGRRKWVSVKGRWCSGAGQQWEIHTANCRIAVMTSWRDITFLWGPRSQDFVVRGINFSIRCSFIICLHVCWWKIQHQLLNITWKAFLCSVSKNKKAELMVKIPATSVCNSYGWAKTRSSAISNRTARQWLKW